MEGAFEFFAFLQPNEGFAAVACAVDLCIVFVNAWRARWRQEEPYGASFADNSARMLKQKGTPGQIPRREGLGRWLWLRPFDCASATGPN